MGTRKKGLNSTNAESIAMNSRIALFFALFVVAVFLAGCTQLGGQAVGKRPVVNIRPVECVGDNCGPQPPLHQCSDGTQDGNCSVTKPLFCQYTTLVNNCSQCGCDANNTCDANTQACVVLPSTPDLIVNSVIVTNSTANSVNFRITLSNIGQAAVTGTWTDRYEVYTSSNQFVTFQNVGGLGGPLAPGQSYVDYANFTNLPTGNYQLYAVADVFGQSAESNENNNTLTQPFTLTDSNSDQNKPNFVISSITYAQLPQGHNVSVTASNIGSAAYTGPLAFDVSLYRSNNQLIQTQTFSNNITWNPGANLLFTKIFPIQPAGSYYFKVIADALNQANESDENDNIRIYNFSVDSNVSLCGNGTIDASEQCDGSNLAGQTCQSLGYSSGSLLCNPNCQFDTNACLTGSSYRVFLTQTDYNGDLGGISGADAKCAQQAAASSLGGTWKAWISTPSSSAKQRLYHSTVPYKRLDNVTIANNWQDLNDGTLAAPINVTSTGQVMSSGEAWSATNADGNYGSVGTCQSWTSSTSSGIYIGSTGQVFATNSFWTNWGYDYCNQSHRLYCFEQPA